MTDNQLVEKLATALQQVKDVALSEIAKRDQRVRQLEAERDLFRRAMEEKNTAAAEALNKLWRDVILSRNPEYGEWEYPLQAYRHLKIEFDRLKLVAHQANDLLGALAEFPDNPTACSESVHYLQDALDKAGRLAD